MLINQSDIDFIFAQLTLPGNDPRNAPLGTVADPTGIRDVQGVGNNVLNPLIGAADQQFLRLTNPTGSTAPQTTPPSQLTPPGTIPTPGSGPATGSDVPSAPANSGGFTQANGVLPTDVYARPNTMVSDPTPRVISNLVADQSPEALAAIGYVSPGQQKLAILDNPSLTPGGRLNPFTGADNPLPYSTFTTMFGQFFDHGLDLVHKGAGGVVVVPLLPGDPLYVEGSPTNFMIASRTNTVEVGIGATSTDSLITSLGLGTFTGNNGLVDKSAASVTGTTFTAPSAAGVLMINGVAIQIAAGRSLAQVVNLINAQEGLTGVTASASGNTLKLDAPGNQSVNVTSPFIDLSQSYGSAASHTVFVREYDANGNITGRLVSGTTGGMATWADIKANAARIGITLNDRDVLDIPEIRFLTNIAGGAGYFDANGEAWLVARHLGTGAVYYVQNSDIAANTVILNAQGVAVNSGDVNTVKASLRLQTIGHAFLDDIAHTAGLSDSRGRALLADADNVVNGDTNGDGVIGIGEVAVDPTRFDNELLNQHFVAGDGRTNENIGLTAIHDVFHSEHNKVLDQIKGLMTVDLVDPNLMVDIHGNKWTGEMLFQAAKLVTEMEYQHLVFGEFVRKLSPNITGFAGYNVTLDPAITAEFAHAVYRFGHSMLTETVGLQQFDPITGKAIADVVVNATSLAVTAGKNELTVTLSAAHNLHTGNYVDLSGITTALGGLDANLLNGSFKVVGVTSGTVLVLELAAAAATTASANSLSTVKAGLNSDVGLIEAFLNPMAYSHTTAGEFAIGSSQQVGNGIDIWVTDALRNNLVGLPLDLATLNIVRGRDAGMLSLNGVRAQLYAATNNAEGGLKPYTSWTEFRDNLVHQETLVNFVMAYSRDAVLNNFGTLNAAAWDADARKTGTGEQKAAYYADYAAALRTAAEAAIADGSFMTFDQGFNSIDFWLGGLAEKAVVGGMLGSTFDFIFAMQMVKLQDADRFYYLNRLAGTNMLAEIEAQLFSDIVMRNTGAQNLYTDIFSVPDSTVYLENPTNRVFNTAFDLGTDANQVNATDINGDTVKVSTAGWVRNPDLTWTFHGNPGNYLDARGVLNANGFGNASEVIVGYDDATAGMGDRISANGGNDTVWGKKGNDTIEGGNGNDFLHGGDGDDVVTDSQGDDLLWGDAGNDLMNAGSGLDQVFGGDGMDTIYGGTGADVIEGGRGDDLIYGDTGSAPSVVGDLNGADIIAGGEGNDTIYGGGGADAMDGGEGDDVFYGGAGADAMTGGLGFGNDVFIMDAVDAIGNAMDGGLGFDTVDYTASNGQVLTINGPVVGLHLNLSVPNALADSFLHIENLIGTRFNDTLVGGAAIVNVYTVDIDGQPILDQNNLRILDLAASIAASVGVAIANDLGDPVIGVDPVTGDPVLVAEDVLIQGGAGDDIVTGGQGNDTLDGGAVTGRTGPGYVPLANDPNSADTLSGGLGNDVYVVDSNNDVIIEGVLIDVFGLALIDPVTGNPTPELVQGIDRVDTTLATYSIRNLDTIENLSYIGATTFNGTGNILNNVITGGAGNDTLNGREGIDTLVGGLGNDIYTVDSTTDVITEAAAGGTDRVNATLAAGLTYTLNAEVENLTLQGNAASNGTGNTLANVITGNTAANVLTSVANTPAGTYDTLVGGAGNDTYVVDDVNVVITETANNGTDTVSTSVLTAYTLSAANVENLIYTDIGNFAGTGSATANIITGGTGNDTLDGAAGNDTLIGGNGNDTLIGNTGVDSMTGGAGIDTFVFVAGSSGTATNRDRIVDFTVGTDKIDLSSFGALQFIGSGNFTTVGQVRAVTVGNVTTVEVNTAGNNGSELSVDLTGALALTAADFSSNVTVAPPTPPTPPVNPNGPPVVPNGPAAALNLTGTNAANTMTGDTGNDTLSGGRGNDTIDGGAGNDVLNGGRDTDVITGGLGNDVLTGGTGADAFIFNSVLNGTTNVDNITDFTAVDDTIRLENAIFTALTATGVLNTTMLRLGTAAVDNNDFIIYDANSGNLWYDADANGAGAQVLFATLSNQEVLTRNDFVVI